MAGDIRMNNSAHPTQKKSSGCTIHLCAMESGTHSKRY